MDVSEEMEAVFLRFECFDFGSDERFQIGVKELEEESRLLDLKLFFYNRFVEPIDRTSYRHWSCSAPHTTPQDQLLQTTRPHSGSEHQTAGTSAETMDVKPLSFAEVMTLVQEGKEVPGATKLDIKPTNQSPAPSQMERKLKPWEMS